MPKKNIKFNFQRVFIIAEVANTHEGSLGQAKQMIKAAADCGADAIKFQTHIFEAESLKSAPKHPTFKDESRESYFKRTAFNLEQYRLLKKYAESLGIEFLSSPFSIEAIDFLEKVGLRTFKVPSGEVSNLPYLERLAKTKKNIFLSSGMSSWQELDEAVETLKKHGAGNITTLQCTSKYPCPPEEAGLNVMAEMKKRYNLPIGLSDHTSGIGASAAAVALGAQVIEKHLTLSKLMYGPDPKYSMEPAEFKLFVQSIREAESAVRFPVNKNKIVQEFGEMKVIYEKSIVANKDFKAGEKIMQKDLAFKKPGDGIPARYYKKVIGKTLKRNIIKDRKFQWNDFK